jgi:hypothetical protein
MPYNDDDFFAHDGDIETHQLNERADRVASLKRSGICLHGHLQTKEFKCLEPDCGKTWETEQEMWDEIDNLAIEYG